MQMRRPLVTHLSALGLLAMGTSFACATARPVEPAAPPPASMIAKTEASPAASPLPTMLMPGIGMAPSKPAPEPEDDTPAPPCAKDEDCWSKTCCPAKAPEECVHALKARRCAIVDVACAKTPITYACICESGVCKGRLSPP